MSTIRCIYHGRAPDFPATDQHPDAKRYGPVVIDGVACFVDAIGGPPTTDEVKAVITPPTPVELTPEQKLNAAGLSVAELKALLALPT
jgi:hypothetical protein